MKKVASQVLEDFNGKFNDHHRVKSACARLHLSESDAAPTAAILERAAFALRHVNHYPEAGSPVLRRDIAAFHDVSEDMVHVGNGCDEIILLSALTFGRSGHSAITSAGTFPGYRMAVAIAGGTMHETLLTPDWHIDLDAMRAAIRADTRVLYVCNPHNPTGTHVDPTALMSLVDAATAQGVVAIIDEAYIDFARGVTRSFVPDVKSGARAIVLRSFSKSYALAGIRVGYAIGSPEDIRAMMQISWSMPFSVNRVAQAIAGDALAAQDLLTERCNAVRSRKLRLYGMLEEYGIWYLRSATNFVFLRAPVATAADAEQAGVLVRDCSGFGNPGYWRVSVGSDAELAQFEAFLKSLKRRKNL